MGNANEKLKKKKDKHGNEEFDTEINFVFPHADDYGALTNNHSTADMQSMQAGCTDQGVHFSSAGESWR